MIFKTIKHGFLSVLMVSGVALGASALPESQEDIIIPTIDCILKEALSGYEAGVEQLRNVHTSLAQELSQNPAGMPLWQKLKDVGSSLEKANRLIKDSKTVATRLVAKQSAEQQSKIRQAMCTTLLTLDMYISEVNVAFQQLHKEAISRILSVQTKSENQDAMMLYAQAMEMSLVLSESITALQKEIMGAASLVMVAPWVGEQKKITAQEMQEFLKNNGR